MRRIDDAPLGDEAIGALLALDATLAGEPVDPEYAELAEIALLLRQERPRPGTEFASALDQRVGRRFASADRAGAAAGTGATGSARGSSGGRRRRVPWGWAPGLGLTAALAVAVIVVAGNGSSSSSSSSSFSSSSAAASAAAPSAGVSSASSAAASAPAQRAPASPAGTGAKSAAGSAASSSAGAGQDLSAIPAPTVPSPPGATSTGGHRQVVQSAQLQLMAQPTKIDDVAQQVFGVVAAEKGIVNSSNVTATGDANGNANFELSVPSANLQPTMSALSQLRGSRVLSRTDSSADITGQVGGAGIRLAEARALRRSLLTQLAAAVTQQQIDSLKTQLRDADASIASDLSTLRGLQRQVQYSRITVAIQAGSTSVAPGATGGGGFTLHRALHDAGRVLVVVAGVALIALAVLVPVVLVAALAAWVGLTVRSRRREHALDLV